MYETEVFEYDYTQAYYSAAQSATVYKYLLKKLFADRGQFASIKGDCRDISNYVCIVFLALGMSAAPAQHFTDRRNGFWTNPLCGMGKDPTVAANYISYAFSYHQTATDAGLTWDATSAQWLDLGGTSYQKPPTGWAVAGYWQTPWTGAPPGSSDFLGPVNRYYGSTNPEGETVTRESTPISLIGYSN
jgi:hypothetical protein